jgi:gliding motility-associated-like protein
MHSWKRIAVYFFLLFSTPLFAQQYNNWYFGQNAGLTFNAISGQPLPSVLSNGEMVAYEGSSTISDSLGNLLFYTNGVTVYNRNHTVMANGNGLEGHVSACQSAVIVQVPGNAHLYYIFTNDAVENQFTGSYKYSIVDMSLDGGNGAVISKNNLLWPSCTERLTAARHQNGVDIWIITNDKSSNIFRSWLLTCNGLDMNPVVSVAGVVLNMHNYVNSGKMIVSPDGKQLCQTHFPFYDEINPIPSFVQLFDFNNATGAITNGRKIEFPATRYTHCAYSPDSRFLYLTRYDEKAIDQLEVALPTVPAIEASRMVLQTSFSHYDIQLGPDEKIYVSRGASRLTVINRPNVKGTGCQLVENQIDLGASSRLGLPFSMNDMFDSNNGFTYTILDSCSGQVQFQGQSNMPGTLSWHWDFGDGAISTLQNPVHLFPPTAQTFVVKMKVSSPVLCGGSVIKSRIIRPRGIPSRVNFEFITRCDSGYVRFINKSENLQAIAGQYTWYFGDGATSQEQDPVHYYSQPGTYTVKLKLNSSQPCLADSLTAEVSLGSFPIFVTPEQTITIGQSVQINALGPAVSFRWSPSDGLSNPAIPDPWASPQQDIVYTVKATDASGCVSTDSVKINVIQYNDIFVPSAFTPNADGKNDILKPFFGVKYTLQEFSIFNRWGGRVFTTMRRGEGWDGTVNGKPQPVGMYVWVLKAKDEQEKVIEQKGSSMLIR